MGDARHYQVKSNHPYAFRSGTWACIYDERVINGRKNWLVAWDDWVFDYWVVDDPAAGYEFRPCPLLEREESDTKSEARASGEDSPVG